jgi:autoinducer 2 (AI-2) kinase
VPGGQDFDVDVNWALIAECIREVLAKGEVSSSDVSGVAATSMREGIVLFGENGRELWACPNVDSRATTEADELVESGAADDIYRISGDWVSITAPARLRWIARHRPGLLEQTKSLGLLSDWIAFKLCGVHTTEPSCGSSTGMFDLRYRTWSDAIVRATGLDPAVLPPVVESGTVIGGVTRAAAEATGLGEGTSIVAGGADTQLALAGVGLKPGQLAIVGGTFWQTAILTEEPVIDPEARLRTLCHVRSGQWMLEGIGFYCGMSMRWLRDALCSAEVAEAQRRGVDPYVVMEERAASSPPGANGVIAIMSNVMNARRWVHASPSYVQLDLNNPAGTGIGAFVRATEEAAAYAARAHRDIIGELCGDVSGEVVFTGGASAGGLWPQIMADVLGQVVQVPVITESTSLGAAMCAGVGTGLYDSFDGPLILTTRARRYEPDPHAAAAYDDKYARWGVIYQRMLEISEDGVLTPLWRGAGTRARQVAVGST